MQLRKNLSLLTLAVALLFGATAVAQQTESTQQQTAPQTIDVSDQQLQQFAEAQMDLAGIQQEFSARLQNVEDPKKARDIQREANQEMTTAVEDAGLDVESFNQIAMAIQNDPELQQQLTSMLQQNQPQQQ